MKKLTAIMAVFLCLNIVPVHAADPKVLAIIDTGVDMSVPSIKNAIAYEVCISNYKSCPNGANLQEGAGSATITPSMLTNDAWSHGTYVASAAIQTDPTIKIVEIRCASLIQTNGFINCNENMLTTALNWVLSNKTKYNIGAVASPLGFVTSTCPTTVPYFDPITKLNAQGIATIFPTGNLFSIKEIQSPACLPGSIAVTAIDDKGIIPSFANYSPRVDFASLGVMSLIGPANKVATKSGTSLSIATFGAGWLKVLNQKNLSYTDQYKLIKNTSNNATNKIILKNVLAINIVKALQ